LNIAILTVLVLALAAIYWYGWRPLPQESGTVKAPIEGRATVVRDSHGVPHITAASVEDALFAQGYVTAQDRLWQMDGLRRLAAGRLSEVLGPGTVGTDHEARRWRLEQIAERSAGELNPADRAVLAAYARGVNAFIESHRNRLPVEFSLLGYDPRPWRIEDSILIGLHMYRTLTSTWRQKLQKAQMMAGGDPAKVDVLFGAGESRPGSNAWAVAGTRTATGKPILANDPHLEYSLPNLWHEVELKAPGLDVVGVAIPGLPCVTAGHNGRIGWGITSLQFDVQDVYLEKMDPRTGVYLYAGKLEQARLERDAIAVKGAAPIQYSVWVTRHGPVFQEGGRYVALRWAAQDGAYAFPFLDLNHARNFQEFTAALARYPGPGLNFVYADVDGNIGSQVAGRLPIRKNYDGSLPVDGSTGEYEWDGYIPFDQLPRTYNPSSGMIVSSNQDPFPENYPYQVSGNFASSFRANQIANMLSARKGWRADDMIAVQKDVYSAFCAFLARKVVAAYDRRGVKGPGLSEAVQALRSWNGQMESGPAPVLSMLIYQHVRKALANRASPEHGTAYDPPGRVGADTVQIAPEVVEQLLRKRPKSWFADFDTVLLRAFLDAVEEGRRMHGRNVSKWDWGESNRLLLTSPVVSRLPLIGKYFNIGPVVQSGSTTSVKQTTRLLGPSMRMTLDFAALGQSYLTLATGESGQALSSHYKDQWEAGYYAQNLPMRYGKINGGSRLEIVPE
jgi:penicillin amidase